MSGNSRPSGSAPKPAAPARVTPLRCRFIHAPDPAYSVSQNYGAKFMPLWVYTLAAHVPQSGRYALAMSDLQYDSLSEVPEADVFLFSGINQDLETLNRVWTHLKQRYPQAIGIVGGPICWSFDQAGGLQRLAGFDHICVGDGEEMFGRILEALHDGRPLPPVIRASRRFDVSKAIPMVPGLPGGPVARYYGAVVEVSRGCPFLCEFCDIRVMEDNNRSHSKSPELIVAELDALANKGVRQIILACDNFIGDGIWAERVVDAILAWQSRTGFRINIYTWLTINLYKMPGLMAKMRRAGFDLLFVGVESFNNHSLLETAKVQNCAVEMTEAIQAIQSYGFIVVAGLIFGFDADEPDFPETTLEGILKSGLISGDPNWLTALPGTPLFRRMKLAGRLRYELSTHGGIKYQTNIRYLLSRRELIDGFRRFVRRYLDGAFQYERFRAYLNNLESENFIGVEGSGFGNLLLFLRLAVGDSRGLAQMSRRLALFLMSPTTVYYALKGLLLTLSRRRITRRFGYFQFWIFAWTNAMFKYLGVRDEQFDIASVPEGFRPEDILPAGYQETAEEKIPKQKIADQLRTTSAQLKQLISRRQLRHDSGLRESRAPDPRRREEAPVLSGRPLEPERSGKP